MSPDVTADGYYVSLLADEGHPGLLALHDALYDGILAAHRRRDIPFIPHVTVGRQAQLQECDRIANQLNEQCRIVRARVDSVDVVRMEESVMRTVAEIRLGLVATTRRTPQCSSPGARVARLPAADRERSAAGSSIAGRLEDEGTEAMTAMVLLS